MKSIIISLLFLLSLQLFASDTNNDFTIKPQTIDCEAIFKSGDKSLLAQSGCCSHHSGVCGCQSGRVTCCDGSYSPSCTCKGGETIIDEDEGFKIKL
jgi:hypothetical protein